MKDVIQQVMDCADGLISAIDGSTGEFEPEVARLSQAVSELEKALLRKRVPDRGRKKVRAPLFDAAPDLLDVLQTLLACDELNIDPDELRCSTSDAIEEARAVIAQARGGAA